MLPIPTLQPACPPPTPHPLTRAFTEYQSLAQTLRCCLQIIKGGFSLMLRHRLHCKIERAETETYLTGDRIYAFTKFTCMLSLRVVYNEVRPHVHQLTLLIAAT